MGILSNNRGVTLIFVAMGMLVFLLFLGLALDTGWLVYVRAQAQARIDSAALAAGAGLVERVATDRENQAKDLADDFSQKNSVNTTGTPENVVVPMSFAAPPGGDDIIKGALDGGWGWGDNGLNCNAVQVTTTVPTRVFFAGIRNFISAEEEETGQENITVSAISHLPCPGFKRTGEKMAPFALQNCPWVASGNFRNSCNQLNVIFDLNLTQATAILAKTDPPLALAPIQIDSSIQLLPLIKEDFPSSLDTCGTGGAAIVPVVDQCTVVAGSPISANVIGFASICLTVGEDGLATVKLLCGEVAPGSTGVGTCFGTYASNPILIQ